MADHVTQDQFKSILRGLMRMQLHSYIEAKAVQVALIHKDEAWAERIEAARDSVAEAMKPMLDLLEESRPEDWSDLLGRFEGPVQ